MASGVKRNKWPMSLDDLLDNLQYIVISLYNQLFKINGRFQTSALNDITWLEDHKANGTLHIVYNYPQQHISLCFATLFWATCHFMCTENPKFTLLDKTWSNVRFSWLHIYDMIWWQHMTKLTTFTIYSPSKPELSWLPVPLKLWWCSWTPYKFPSGV